MNLASGMTGSPNLDLALDLVMKATALLWFVLSLQYWLRGRRPLLGSAIGNAGLLGLLLLPVSTLVLPALTIACLPTPVSPESNEIIEILSYQEPLDSGETSISIKPMRISESTSPTFHEPRPAIVSTPVVVSEPPSTPAWHLDGVMVAFAIYVIVALMLFARLGCSIASVERLRRTCEPVVDTEWNAALDRWRTRLGIRREVMLTWSPNVSVPLVVGWLRPTIVLPVSLTATDASRHADAVLLHELVHVRRGDYPWNLVLRVVQILYWPHVLVWLLGRVIAEVRERACDDLCIHEMGGTSSYRETLLTIASGMIRKPSPALGLAMARPSRLGRRLDQIQRSSGCGNCLSKRPVRLAIGVVSVIAAGLLGSLHLARATSPQTPKPAPAPAVGRTFHLQVVEAETGKPVPNADVRVWMAFRNDDWRKTDEQGRIDITHSTGPSDQRLGYDVWGKGRAMQRYNWGDDPNKTIPDGDTVKLQPGETLGGRVQDEEGRPVAGAIVYLWSHNYKRKDSHELLFDLRATTGPDGQWQTSGAPETTGELLGFHVEHPDFISLRGYGDQENIPRIAELRASKAVTVARRGVPIEGRVVDAKGNPVVGAMVSTTQQQTHVMDDPSPATTDADGRFRARQVKIDSGEWFVGTLAKGHAPDVHTVKIGKESPWVEIDLGVPRKLLGRVVDLDDKPIAGAFIDVDGWQTIRGLRVFLYSDADGRFHWDDAPSDALTLNVQEQGYFSLFQQKVDPSDEVENFRLRPSLAISGFVRDAETKKRVDNATVQYSVVDPKTGEATQWTAMHQLGFGTGVYQGRMDLNFAVTADAYKIRVESPGYKTFVSRTFRSEEKAVIDYDIALAPGADNPTGKVATVLRPDGKPLAGARVLEVQEHGSVTVSEGVPNVAQGRGVREGRTTPDGKFSIPQYEKPWCVVILGDDSYAIANKEALEKSPKIVTKPYSQVRGRYLIGTRPVPNWELQLSGRIDDSSSFGSIHVEQRTKTDAQGQFLFRNVVPDSGLRVAPFDRTSSPGRGWSLGEPVRVEPGATADVMLGGKGRPVIGRIEGPEGAVQPVDFTVESDAGLETNYAWTPYPLSLFRGKTALGAEWQDWLRSWGGTPDGREHAARRVAKHVGIAGDGSFRIDDVPPGEYRLAIRVNGKARFHITASSADPGGFGRIVRTFTVPPIPGGRTDEPLDLGVMPLRPRAELKPGAPAPGIEVTTIDGKKLAVPGDFRGKYLLLDFSTLWDTQSGIQITRLNDVYQKSATTRASRSSV